MAAINGDLLRHTADGNCLTTSLHYETPKWKSACAEFRRETAMLKRTHLYFVGEGVTSADRFEVSLLTQFTVDRFSVFLRLCEHWKGPIHAVLYAKEADSQELLRLVEQSPALRRRKNLNIHVVYRRGLFYPINLLRNVALQNSKTPYSVFIDVDLVPNKDLYQQIRMELSSLKDNNTVSKERFIVRLSCTHAVLR